MKLIPTPKAGNKVCDSTAPIQLNVPGVTYRNRKVSSSVGRKGQIYMYELMGCEGNSSGTDIRRRIKISQRGNALNCK